MTNDAILLASLFTGIVALSLSPGFAVFKFASLAFRQAGYSERDDK